MPLRLRFTRISVRTLTQGQDPDEGTPTQEWAHDRYQKFRLQPISGEMAFRMSRSGYIADWVATGRAKPVVNDTDRLVTFIQGGQELVFAVVKVLRYGPNQQVLLKENPELQS